MIIYLFSETRRGYREVEFSDGSFNTCGYLGFLLNLILSQCSARGAGVLYRKAPVVLGSDCSSKLFKLDLFFWEGGDCRWQCKWVIIFLIPIQNVMCNSWALLLSLMGWQQLVGVVQRNQPCLHGRPMCGIVDRGLFPFCGSRDCRQLQLVKSAFSISSHFHLLFFFFFLPSYQHGFNVKRNK